MKHITKEELDKIFEESVDEISDENEKRLAVAFTDLLKKKGVKVKGVTEKPMEDLDEDELDQTLSELPAKIRKNLVILPKDEYGVEPPETRPLRYTIKKGDTLKKIAEKFNVSFGELTNYLMAKNGSTMIAAGMDIEIPRHFIDLSQA